MSIFLKDNPFTEKLRKILEEYFGSFSNKYIIDQAIKDIQAMQLSRQELKILLGWYRIYSHELFPSKEDKALNERIARESESS